MGLGELLSINLHRTVSNLFRHIAYNTFTLALADSVYIIHIWATAILSPSCNFDLLVGPDKDSMALMDHHRGVLS